MVNPKILESSETEDIDIEGKHFNFNRKGLVLTIL